MKIFQPIVNCGLNSGDMPIYFEHSFGSFVGFATEKECADWIAANNSQFTMDEISGGVHPQEFDVEDPTIIDANGFTLIILEEKPFQKTMSKIDSLMPELREQCIEFLTEVLNENGGDLTVEDPDDYETVRVSYDGGAHPEYASNCFSFVNRVFFKNNVIYLDIEDCEEYNIDRINTDELANVCDFIVRHNKC